MSEIVEIFCDLPATPGKEDRLRQVLVDLTEHVRKIETSNQVYLVWEFPCSTGTMFHIFERWDSQAALDNHGTRPWLEKIRDAFEKEDLIIGGEVIRKVKMVGVGYSDRRVL